MMPLARMDCASSWSRAGSKSERGCIGFGSMRLMGSFVGSAEEWPSPLRPGAENPGTVGRAGSSAERPLPNALRFSGALLIRDDLLGEFDIAFGPAGPDVVK